MWFLRYVRSSSCASCVWFFPDTGACAAVLVLQHIGLSSLLAAQRCVMRRVSNGFFREYDATCQHHSHSPVLPTRERERKQKKRKSEIERGGESEREGGREREREREIVGDSGFRSVPLNLHPKLYKPPWTFLLPSLNLNIPKASQTRKPLNHTTLNPKP